MEKFEDAQRVWAAIQTLASCNAEMFWTLWQIKREHIARGTYRTADGPTTEYVDQFTQAQTRYGGELFERLVEAFGIILTVDDSGIDLRQNEQPFVIMANHVSTFDIPALYGILARLGWSRTAWTMKKELRWLPWGWASAEMFGAFLGRDRDPADRAAIKATGRAAQRYKAGVVVYPEGTRKNHEGMARSPHKELMKLRPGGVVSLLEEMPDAFLLRVNFFWGEDDRTQGDIRTIGGIRSFVGRVLHVRVRIVSRDELEPDLEASIRRVWTEMDDELVGLRVRQARAGTIHVQV